MLTTDRSQEPRGCEIMNKKFGCLPTLVLAGGLIWLGALIYVNNWPAREAIVNLSIGDATARFQTWHGLLSSAPFVLRVDTPRGSLSAELWADWGPASDINLYQTPENWLVGIGGGGTTVLIDVMNSSGPRLLIGAEQDKTNDADWKYIGVAVGDSFVSASRIPECIALFGSGYSPYRKKFQAEQFCSQSVQTAP